MRSEGSQVKSKAPGKQRSEGVSAAAQSRPYTELTASDQRGIWKLAIANVGARLRGDGRTGPREPVGTGLVWNQHAG